MKDMLTFYTQTMEGRRRLLFPHLSRESGRLVTKYTSVIDVSSFGPQHFGPLAMQFMRGMGAIFAENYDDAVKGLYIINAPFWFYKVRDSAQNRIAHTRAAPAFSSSLSSFPVHPKDIVPYFHSLTPSIHPSIHPSIDRFGGSLVKSCPLKLSLV